MNLSNHRIKSIFVFILGTGLITLFFYNLAPQHKNIVNFFTLYGTFASLFGLWLTYVQIQSINQTSKLTNTAVEKSLIRINQVLSVSDLSRANKIIQEIQSFILGGKQDLALLRLKDLKTILIQVKFNEDLTEYTNTDLYNQHITDLGSDINNLNDLILGQKKGINFSKVNQNLENLATVITEFENKLKFKQHDTR